MEYSVVEGRKVNTVNYASGGYLYVKVRSSQSCTYVKCSLNRASGCPGYAHINHVSNTLNVTHEHVHDENAYKHSEFALRNKLKRAAESSSEKLRQVFNDTCRGDPASTLVSFQQVESTMCKKRRKLLPLLPKDIQDFYHLIVETPYSHLYKASVSVNGGSAVILASDFMLEKIKGAEQIQFDGTFFTVPRIFYQLFTIFITFNRHSIPAIHILMDNKTEELYSTVIMKLSEIIPDFRPKFAISDFEKEPRNVFKELFPEIQVTGCWFHFTQAIWKRTQILGLGNLYRKDNEFSSWVRKLMALPLLPETEILGMFSQLETQTFEFEIENNLINKFKRYYKKTWIIGENPLSVFSSEHATNNGAETFHKTLKSVVKVHHPNAWKFLSDLNNIIIDFESEYQRLEQGLNITRNPKRKDIANAQFRIECKEKFINGTYSIQQYLNSLSGTIGYIGRQTSALNSTETNEEASDNEDEVDGMIIDTCIICCQPKQGTFALVPCGQANLCKNCGQHFIDENKPCPVCRSDILTIMQIFQ